MKKNLLRIYFTLVSTLRVDTVPTLITYIVYDIKKVKNNVQYRTMITKFFDCTGIINLWFQNPLYFDPLQKGIKLLIILPVP